MHKIKSVTLLTAIIALVVLSSQVALADSHTDRPFVVMLVDRQAVRESDVGADLAKSAIGLVSTLRNERHFVFIGASAPTESYGPMLPGGQDFAAFQDGLHDWLTSAEVTNDVDVLGAIAESSVFLDSMRASRGSTIYLITSDSAETDLGRSSVRMRSLPGLFQGRGWALVGLSLGTPSGATGFLSNVSKQLGGKSFELSTPQGLKELSDKILADEAKGSLADLGGGELSSADVLTSKFSIVPGTREANLLVFKENTHGSLRLSNPEGFEASAGDRAISVVIDTPFVVIWRLIDPSPGEWQVNIRGVEGGVSIWHYEVNRYTPVLEPSGPAPLNQPATLVASVKDGQQRAVLEEVRLTARVTSPDGVTLAHELNDRGVSGDAIAGDGYFSVAISPLSIDGRYVVELELSWPGFDHRITTRSGFMAEAFPTIDVTTIQTEGLKPGVRAKIADILVHIQGQPYAIPTDQLTASVASRPDVPGLLEVKPERLLDEGRAWSYEVFFTPEGEALHTMALGLDIEYSGRRYSYTSDSMVLSSVLPSPPARQAVVAQAPPPPPPTPAPVRQPQPSAPGSYWGLLAIPIAIILLLLGWAIYWLTRSRPYGFLYNDRNELVVDFSAMKRSKMMALLFKNSVWGKELSIPGLEGVSFNFGRRRIDLRSREVSTNVRVNNQPLVGETPIKDRTWIGTRGKLYSFLLSSSPTQLEGGAAGDDG